MSDEPRNALSAYGAIAGLDVNPTVQAGRYPFQDEAERGIIHDVIAKLGVACNHRLLDIGCGAGLLLIPLSYMVREAVGLDHAETIAALKQRFSGARVTLVSGGFPDTPISGLFDRIVAYSVVHYLDDAAHVEMFITRAAALLSPGGRLLIGDIPNRDRVVRYRASQIGQKEEVAWAKRKAEYGSDILFATVSRQFEGIQQVGNFSDNDLCNLMLNMRNKGFEAYLLSQPADLPFGRTREDLLIVRT